MFGFKPAGQVTKSYFLITLINHQAVQADMFTELSWITILIIIVVRIKGTKLTFFVSGEAEKDL